MRGRVVCAAWAAVASLLVACRGERRTDAGASAEATAASAAPTLAPNVATDDGGVEVASSDAGVDEPKGVFAVSATPVVDLRGESHPRPPALEGPARLAAISMATDVRARPDPAAKRVGWLRAGAVVAADAEPSGRAGCPGGWHRIEPFGFVCVGPEATRDLEHPIVRASTRRPDTTQKLPYMYGIVRRGGPVYARIPTAEQVAKHEPSLKKQLDAWRRDKESGAAYGVELWHKWKDRPAPPALEALEQRITDDDIPWFLAGGGVVPDLSGRVKSPDAVVIDTIARRQGVAFVDSFLHEGRRWAVSTDLRVMPADRFRPIKGSDFHGWVLGEPIPDRPGEIAEMPLAVVRRKGGKRFRWDPAGEAMIEIGDLPDRALVLLTGKQRYAGKHLHYEARDGSWVDERWAGRVDPAKKMPGWAKNGEKWIDVNLTKQVLVAYEGERPVYVTLVASGEAGLDDPETTRATKRGIFRVHTKHVSVTMDSETVGEEFELRDVPYVQYFEEGYALHGAYWHDAFGQPKSHGCINLAPEDARRLFWWTEPQVPAGWHGVAKSLTGTVVFVHP